MFASRIEQSIFPGLLAILKNGEALRGQRLANVGFVSPEHHGGVAGLHEQGHEHGHQGTGDIVNKVDRRVPVKPPHPFPYQRRQAIQHLPDCRGRRTGGPKGDQLRRVERLPAHENALALVIANIEPSKIVIEDWVARDEPRFRDVLHEVVHDDHLLQHRLGHRELQGVLQRLINFRPLAGRVRFHLPAVHDVPDYRRRRLRDNTINDKRLGYTGTAGVDSICQEDDGVSLPEQSAAVLEALLDRVHRLGRFADEVTTRRDVVDQTRTGDTAGHGSRGRLRLPQIMHDPVERPSATELCETNHCWNPFSS